LDALCSLRGATKYFDIFEHFFKGKTPSHVSIQNWMLQYGLYELSLPVENRNDWVYILDHTIEFGTQKCLLILGITLEKLRHSGVALTHRDMRVLKMDIQNKSNAEKVENALDKLITVTGTPSQIISDHGADLKKGIENICAKYPGIRYTYDITHKCAILLKHYLKDDVRWKDFVQKYAHTKRKTVHTKFAFLAPPKPKDKARWLNLDLYVRWAEKIILFRENIYSKMGESQKDKTKFIAEFDILFDWIYDFKTDLHVWRNILCTLDIAKEEVKNRGLKHDTAELFKNKVRQLNIKSTKLNSISKDIYNFLEQQTDEIAKNEVYLGTSDIIESIFGKYKSFSAKTPIRDIGKTILTIPVFTGELSYEKLAEAFATVKMKNVTDWIKNNIGTSLFAKRVEAYRLPLKI